ncbi:MAG: hypothetical protein IKI57_03240 [Clostridia bacterium]|nr:hypothetical protein [Clostridia bacterium]
MKKSILSIILITFVIILTGCASTYSSNDVLNILNERYPNDSFTILSEEKIMISTNVNNTNQTEGTKWHIKSNITDLDFYAQDYMGGSTWSTQNTLKDNYFDVYYMDFIHNLNDYRIKVETYVVDEPYGITSISGTHLYFSDYNYSKSAIADAANSLSQKIKSDSKLMNLLPTYFWINIYDGKTCIASLSLNDSSNKNQIVEKLTNELEKLKDPYYNYTPTGTIKE